jgi:hypothetical protein
VRGRARTTRRPGTTVIVLLALVLGATGQSASGATTKAALRVVKLKPFTIGGSGFKPQERVTMRLSGGVKGNARGTATARGRITVSFPKAKVTACTGYTLRAVGAAGTKVTFKRTVTASCKPAAALKFTGTDVVVSGTHYRPGEKLSVTLVEGGGSHKKAAEASSAGAFRVDFGALPMNACTAYKLTITGSLGSRFSTSREALPC